MIFYICKYTDYTDLPAQLFCEHSPTGAERKSLDGTKFIVRCDIHAQAAGCLSWMNGSETQYTHGEILAELTNLEWTTEDN